MTSSVVYASLGLAFIAAWGSVVQKTPPLETPPLDEIRRSPIDRIDHAVSASVVRRIVRRDKDRADVTPFSSGI
jgi:hypothetical protein